MKKSLKMMTAVAVTMTTMVVTQPTVMAMGSMVDVLPTLWVSRTLQEVKHSIEQTQQPGVYTVQWGDTLSTISQATGISIQELSALNNIADINLIIAGSTLYIDYANHTITYATPTTEAPVTVSTETGEVVETPAEVVSQVASAVSSAEITELSTEISSTTMADEQAASLIEPATEHSQASVESTLPEVTVAEETVNESVEVVAPASVESVETSEATNETANTDTVDPAVQGTPMTVEATAYSYQEAGLSNFTADGTDLTQDSRVIAVDPSVIPLGTMVYIPGYGTYRAADTGGAIVGNKIDIHFNSVEECYQFGRQQLAIYILK